MSYPILYNATETSFDHNGIGILSACVSCEVTEEANGIFELAMAYPMDGIHYEDIADRAIIKAKADQFRESQLFRVYAISRPMNGIVTVLAEHISYDLSGIPVKTFSASSASSALAGLKNNAVVDCPFEFWTDKATSARFSVPTPASIRSRLGGSAGSILDVYGGEYEFDNYTVKLHNSRGMNRGVSIRYGKNLTDIKQDQNCSNVATGVYPYWAGTVDEKDVLVELPERIVNAPGTYNFVKIRTLDLSSEFETQPTVERLRSKTESYIKNNNIGVPSVSLTVSFAQLEQSEEYKHLKLLERVSLFDTVNVEFPALGVSATAKAVRIVYDVIADRVKSVTLGSVRANIADTIATQQKEIDYSKDKPTLSMVQKISSALAKAIMGADGGAVRLIDTNDDGEPDELYIADNADPTKALKVWRFNYNGWAASKNGYSGPFEFGATLEEGLLANFVTAAHLVAGTIKSADSGETFFLDLDNGVLKGKFQELSISGKTVDTIAQEKANAAEGNAKTYADTVASEAVSAQTQTDIFNKLTNNGALQGLYMKDGKLYINASYLATGILSSQDNGKTFFLDLDNGILNMNATSLNIGGQTVGEIANSSAEKAVDNQTQTDIFNKLTNNGTVKGVYMRDGELYINASYLATGILSSQDNETFYLDLDKGILNMKANSLSISGQTVDKIASDAADDALVNAKKYADRAASNAVDNQTQLDVFNILTNNGQDQGIYLQDGKVYINTEYLMSGSIYSENIKLNGLFEVRADPKEYLYDYLGGYVGYMTGKVGDSGGIISDGVAIYNAAKNCYVIVTDYGVRLQAGDVNMYLTPDGTGVTVEGDLKVTGNIQYGGSLEAKN